MRRLTRRQAEVLSAIERRERATLIDLHEDLPTHAPSAIWRVCEALIRKGAISAEGDQERRYLGGVHLRPAGVTLAALGSDDPVLGWTSMLAALLRFAGEQLTVEIRLAGVAEPLTEVSTGGIWTSDEMLVFLVEPDDELAPDMTGNVRVAREAFAEARTGEDVGIAYVEIQLVVGASLVVYARHSSYD